MQEPYRLAGGIKRRLICGHNSNNNMDIAVIYKYSLEYRYNNAMRERKRKK
jgi:hypothetical protein